jgi:hypothetical protein
MNLVSNLRKLEAVRRRETPDDVVVVCLGLLELSVRKLHNSIVKVTLSTAQRPFMYPYPELQLIIGSIPLLMERIVVVCHASLPGLLFSAPTEL